MNRYWVIAILLLIAGVSTVARDAKQSSYQSTTQRSAERDSTGQLYSVESQLSPQGPIEIRRSVVAEPQAPICASDTGINRAGVFVVHTLSGTRQLGNNEPIDPSC